VDGRCGDRHGGGVQLSRERAQPRPKGFDAHHSTASPLPLDTAGVAQTPQCGTPATVYAGTFAVQPHAHPRRLIVGLWACLPPSAVSGSCFT